jgi:hypothetical protein
MWQPEGSNGEAAGKVGEGEGEGSKGEDCPRCESKGKALMMSSTVCSIKTDLECCRQTSWDFSCVALIAYALIS